MQSCAVKVSKRSWLQSSRWLLIGLLAVEIALAPIYLGSLLLTGDVIPLFDLNRAMSLPSWLQAAHLFSIGAIALLFCLFQSHRSPRRPSQGFVGAIATLALYGSIDEVFKIHLKTAALFPSLNKDFWIGFYVFALIAIPVAFHRDFIALWQRYRRPSLLALLGMGIFMVGGFGSEIFSTAILSPLLKTHFQSSETLAIFAEALRVAFEECLELIGESFVLYGILVFIATQMDNKQTASRTE